MFFAESVSKAYGAVPVLVSASLIIGDGEHVALVGPNGCGKSTLLRIIAGEEEADVGQAGVRGGALAFLRQDAELDSVRTLEQEMWSAFPEAQAIEARLQAIAEALEQGDADFEALIDEQAELFERFEAMDGYRIDKRIGRVLQGLGFTPADLHKPCATFSGGWRMRVALAQALVRQPEHLLLDEPTNHLDTKARAWLTDYLKRYHGAVLIVAHDADFLDRVVDRVIDLRDGCTTSYTGNHTDYQRQKAEQIAQQASAAQRQGREVARQERFIERFRATSTKARQVQSRIKALDKVERIRTPKAQREVNFAIAAEGRSARIVVSVTNLSHAYDEQIVLCDANFDLERGDKAVLLGANGSGKSTLLRALAGVFAPTEGSIVWGDRTKIGYYDQHQDDALDPDHTVLEEVRSVAPARDDGELRKVLARFLFRGDDVRKPIAVLSGGERSRVALAKLLLRPSNVLLLDEPTNHLDITTRRKLVEALVAYEGTILCASHDPSVLERVATKAFELVDGECRPLTRWTDWRPPGETRD